MAYETIKKAFSKFGFSKELLDAFFRQCESDPQSQRNYRNLEKELGPVGGEYSLSGNMTAGVRFCLGELIRFSYLMQSKEKFNDDTAREMGRALFSKIADKEVMLESDWGASLSLQCNACYPIVKGINRTYFSPEGWNLLVPDSACFIKPDSASDAAMPDQVLAGPASDESCVAAPPTYRRAPSTCCAYIA